MTEPTSTERGAAVYTPFTLKLYDWWVLGVSNRLAWQCQTGTTLLPFFRKHVGRRHLDVGVGTGFYLEHAGVSPGTQLTLMDLNENSLQAAARRSGLQAACIRHDIMQPLPLPPDTKFDSVSMFYLLHCLPGTIADKERAVVNLKAHLAPAGTLYGATILGDCAGHNWFGGRLMALYNRKGIFGNKTDSLDALTAMLRRHFADVDVRQQGKVALFTAVSPMMQERKV